MQCGALGTASRRPGQQSGGGPSSACARLERGAPRSDTVQRLRLPVESRPLVDAGLSGGLRAWLEDGLWPLVGSAPADGAPVVIDRRSAASALEDPGRPREQAARSTALEAMARALFKQLVTTGAVRDPFADGLAALRVDERLRDVAELVANLPEHHRNALRRDVVAQAATMSRQWPPIAAGWHPSTGERTSVRLAGGRVVLTGVADLVLGRPSEGRASVCLVDLRQGRPQPGHRTERRWAALLETLRGGAPPFRTATYYPAIGQLEAEDPTDSILASTVHEVIAVVARRDVGRASGGAPSSSAATRAGRAGSGDGDAGRSRDGASPTTRPRCAIALPPMLLPRARALTDALTVPARAVAAPVGGLAFAARLEHRLARLVAPALCQPGGRRRPAPAGSGGLPADVAVTSYLLRTALTAPERLRQPDPFSWSPRTARRKIGVAAVSACAAGAWRTPAEAVAATIRAIVAQGRPGRARPGSLPAWLCTLPEAGRAAVRAEATTWATRLWGSLEWWRLGAGVTVGGPDAYWASAAPRQPEADRVGATAGEPPRAVRVVVRGRADVRADVGRGSSVFVTMAGGEPGPTARVELGLAALVTVLGNLAGPPAHRQAVPVRVAGWWPDCGRAIVLPVDQDLLVETATALVLAAERLVTANGHHAGDAPDPPPAGEDGSPRLAARGSPE